MEQQDIRNPYQPFEFTRVNFVGRQDVLNHLDHRIHEGTREFVAAKHILLMGDGGTGKTWLLHRFLEDLPDAQFRKIHLDVGNYIGDLQGFLAQFAKQAGYATRVQLSLLELMRSLSIGFPMGVSISPGALFMNRLPDSIDEMLRGLIANLIQLAQRRHKMIVVALDQYGRISEMQGGMHIVRYLATLMRKSHDDTLSRVLLVFALRPERKGVLELPFGNEIFNPDFVNRFSLGSFSEKEARAAISEPARAVGRTFDERTVDSVLCRLGNPNPYYLQLACRLVWEQATVRPGGRELLYLPEDQVQDVLSEGQSKIFRRFTEAQRSILKVLAQSHPVPTSIRQMQPRLENSGLSDVVGDIEHVVSSLVNHPDRPLRFVENVSGYRINHDLFADYILERECAPEDYEVTVLQGILDYAPGLFRVTGFVLDEKLLDRIWLFRNRLQLSDDVLGAVARSVLDLDQKKWEIHFQWFATLRSRFSNALIALVSDPNENTRLGAIKAMGLVNDPVCSQPLIRGLSDGSPDIRQAAAEALGKLGDDAALLSVVAVLRDDNASVREAAARALGRLRASNTLAELERLLRRDEDDSVKEAAAEAIAAIGSDAAFASLEQATRRGKTNVRIIALQHLATLAHEGVVKILVDQLSSKNQEIRFQAVEALAKLKAPESIPYLVKRTSDDYVYVVRSAIRVLGGIADPQAIQALICILSSDSLPQRDLAYATLQSLERRSTIIEQVSLGQDEPACVKILKARLLSRSSSKVAFEKLLVLASEGNEVVRSHFVGCLKQYEEDWISPSLAKALRDESAMVRKVALRVIDARNLKSMNGDVSVLCSDPDRSVRWFACRVNNRMTQDGSVQAGLAEETERPGHQVPREVCEKHNRWRRLTETVLSYPPTDDHTQGPVSALTDNNPTVKVHALRLLGWRSELGKMYETDGFSQLLDSLSSDTSINVRVMARLVRIRHMRVQSERDISALLKFWGDPCWPIRTAALRQILNATREAKFYQDLLNALKENQGDLFEASVLDLKYALLEMRQQSSIWQRPMLRVGKDENFECIQTLRRGIHELEQKEN